MLEEVVKVLFEKEIMEGEELRMFLGGANAEAESETTGPIQADGNETEPDRGSSGNGSPYNEGKKQDVSETMDRKFPGNTDSVASDHDEQGTT